MPQLTETEINIRKQTLESDLMAVKENLKKLDENRINEYAKNSLINERVKRIEIEKKFEIIPNEELLSKVIDNIIKEPEGGAHYNPEEIYYEVKETIIKDIESLTKINPKKRNDRRIEKFCSMGIINE